MFVFAQVLRLGSWGAGREQPTSLRLLASQPHPQDRGWRRPAAETAAQTRRKRRQALPLGQAAEAESTVNSLEVGEHLARGLAEEDMVVIPGPQRGGGARREQRRSRTAPTSVRVSATEARGAGERAGAVARWGVPGQSRAAPGQAGHVGCRGRPQHRAACAGDGRQGRARAPGSSRAPAAAVPTIFRGGWRSARLVWGAAGGRHGKGSQWGRQAARPRAYLRWAGAGSGSNSSPALFRGMMEEMLSFFGLAGGRACDVPEAQGGGGGPQGMGL